MTDQSGTRYNIIVLVGFLVLVVFRIFFRIREEEIFETYFKHNLNEFRRMFRTQTFFSLSPSKHKVKT